MATILPVQPPAAGDCRRWVIGVRVASDCSRLATTIVACDGRGLDLTPEIIDGMTAEVPVEIAALFHRLAEPGPAMGGTGVSPVGGTGVSPVGDPSTSKMPVPPAAAMETLASLRAGLAELQAAVVNALLTQAGVPQGRALAIGVQDPGLWSRGSCQLSVDSCQKVQKSTTDNCQLSTVNSRSPVSYLGLCDAARLAELTGLSVVDAFPARDVASGGRGGPLTPLAQWLLLKDPSANRLLLDLGRTTRVSYLPRAGPDTRGVAKKGDRLRVPETPLPSEKGTGSESPKCLSPFPVRSQGEPRVLSFDVGPGMRMLDLLVERLTNGEEAFDPGGRYAVQGRRVQELIDHWLADPYFRRPLPRWHPRGVPPERFLLDAMQIAVDKGWSIRDLLCTATHFIAESVALAVHLRMPDDLAVDEILLTGGGRHNGMLLRELGAVFPGPPLVPIGEIGIEAEALGPACYALMALFYLDQVPANRPEVTGAEMCRVLGRLTPGSPQNWQHLITEMADAHPTIRPLRSAL